MFPSPADSARMDSSGTTSPTSVGGANASTGERYQGNSSGSLYPDLSMATQRSAHRDYEEDDDILATMGLPPAKSKAKPVRPPPPSRNNTAPALTEQSASKKSRSSPVCLEPAPLFPHEVRWFYKAPGKFWQPMRGADSLLLEQTYLSMKGVDQQKGATPTEDGGDEEVVIMGGMYVVDIPNRTMKPIYWAVKEEWSVLRGLWYEIVSDKWYPFTEADCARIEETHCKSGWREKAKRDSELQQWAHSPSTVRSANGRSQSVTTTNGKEDTLPDNSCVLVNKLSLEKYDIHWMANGDIHKIKTELSSQIWNKVGEKLGKGSLFGATKVVRGYKERASGEDRLPPIGHIVFVVHGIGQNMDMSSIEKSSSDFREVVTKVAKKNFLDNWQDKRVEFLPVDWRTWLSLDKGLVNQVTPPGLKMFRGLVNDCVMDISLYYFSPIYGAEILDGLKFSLQKQYNEFMRRNPHFSGNGGTVSVIGHSLGSVLMFDLLQEKAERDAEMEVMTRGVPTADLLASPPSLDRQVDLTDDGSEIEKEIVRLKQRVAALERQVAAKNAPKTLSFNVDHLFIYGSPLALFIAMKETGDLVVKDHRCAASILPCSVCKRLHNVHHPSDPIAYRLEPLINSLYAQVKPVKIGQASSKISQDSVDHAEGPMTDETLKEKHQQQGKSWWSGMKNSIVNYASAKIMGAESTDGGGAAAPSKTPVPDKMIDSDKKFLPEERLKERLDFVMREGLVENSYLNSITAHFSYWSSADVAQHLLLQLYTYKPT